MMDEAASTYKLKEGTGYLARCMQADSSAEFRLGARVARLVQNDDCAPVHMSDGTVPRVAPAEG
ncbi:FAD-dependent oxidoreductase [Arthrobacter sp. A5]|uniref:FAD-dependent oxidoreductase n=1 Tax=Arthrobacter sp. A5 TaxID=576926 RepID=UPI003DA87523